jgi:hypothetical protein
MKTKRVKIAACHPSQLAGILATTITILLAFGVLPNARGQDLFWTGTAASPAAAEQ